MDWKMVATGTKIEEVKISEEQMRSSFISGPVRDFMIVAGSQLNLFSVNTTEGILLNHWSTSDAAEENSDIALKIAGQALEIFQSEFGPYPYKELDLVAVPLDNALGVEYPGLILIQDGLYQIPDEYNTFAIVIAHEIAHQWWYNLIGNDVYQAPWLDEALATYSGYLYARKLSPDFYTGVMQYQKGRVNAIESEFGPQPFDRPIDFYLSNERAYSAIVYQKGALFLDALRVEIGDRDFSQALKTYYSTYRYQMVVPNDLLNQFENSCSCQLAGFFSDWGVQQIP
jgi:aminopeptidase N